MMRKILFLFLLFAAFVSMAQNQYKSMLGVNTFFNYEKMGSYSSTSFTIAPKYGYQIKPNLTVGVSVGLNSYKLKGGMMGSDKNSNLMISPFVRYSKSLNDKFNLIVEPGVTAMVDLKEDNHAFGVGTTMGLQYFVTPRMGLELQLLNFQMMKYTGGSDLLEIQFSHGFINPNMGVSFYF